MKTRSDDITEDKSYLIGTFSQFLLLIFRLVGFILAVTLECLVLVSLLIYLQKLRKMCSSNRPSIPWVSRNVISAGKIRRDVTRTDTSCFGYRLPRHVRSSLGFHGNVIPGFPW